MKKKRKKYIAAHGAPFPKKMAQKYGEYLNEVLPKRLGHQPTTDEIWQDAQRNRRCPYRDLFTWNVRRAAESYWRVQARNLANHIAEVVVVEGERKVCRSFFPIRVRRGLRKTWFSMGQIQSDPEMMNQVIEAARHEMACWVDRYSLYNSLGRAMKHAKRALKVMEPKKKKGGKRRK